MAMGHRAESSTRSPQLERKRTAASTCVAPLPLILCDTCGSGDDELLRDRCDRGRHTLCLRPVAAKGLIGPCFCLTCAPAHHDPQEANRFPTKQVKIVDFFRIQKDAQLAARCRLSQGSDARRWRKCSLIMHKKRRILPFVPIKDGARRVKQMASLATALPSSNTEFINELTYMPNMTPRSSNLARLEVSSMQVQKSFT